MSSVAFLDYQHYAIDQKNDSGAITNNVIQWGYAIGLPVVGILLLCFFLSLGGAKYWDGIWVVNESVLGPVGLDPDDIELQPGQVLIIPQDVPGHGGGHTT